MIATLEDLMKLVDNCTAYLEVHGVPFNKAGFPTLDKSVFLDEFPLVLTTFKERNAWFVTEPERTVICSFTSDQRTYPRLDKVLSDIPVYRSMQGAVGADLTVTNDMDVEWKRFTMLVNALFTAVLAVNGIKVVANIRHAGPETLDCLDWIPSDVLVATSTLGCDQTRSALDMDFVEKLLRVRPRGILLYGKKDELMEAQAARFAIPVRRYDDVHSIHKRKKPGRDGTDAVGGPAGTGFPTLTDSPRAAAVGSPAIGGPFIR